MPWCFHLIGCRGVWLLSPTHRFSGKSVIQVEKKLRCGPMLIEALEGAGPSAPRIAEETSLGVSKNPKLRAPKKCQTFRIRAKFCDQCRLMRLDDGFAEGSAGQFHTTRWTLVLVSA